MTRWLAALVFVGASVGLALAPARAVRAPVLLRRYGKAAKTITPLSTLASQDVATSWYTFNQTSGNLVNQAGDSTYDLSVDSSVVRSVSGPVAPYLVGMHVPGTNGSGVSPYGHIEGQRSSMNGHSLVSCEAVLKLGTVAANSTLLDGEWTIGVARMSMDYSGASVPRGDIINGFFAFTGAMSPTGWHHYVWTTDGSTQKMYYDGSLANSSGVGGGSNDGTGNNARVAIGGLESVTDGASAANTNNKDTYWAFLAYYVGTTLTQAQVSSHFAASGCPA